MKKIVLIAGLVIITGLLSAGGVYYYLKNKTDKEKSNLQNQITQLEKSVASLNDQLAAKTTNTTASTTNGTSTSTATSTTNANAWKTYTNSTYGFQLTLTDAWKGYSVYEKTGDGNATKYLYFTMPTTDKSWVDSTAASGYASIFVVSVFTTANWTKELADVAETGLPEPPSVKGTNYVYSWSHAQAAPSDFVSANFEYDKIVASIKAL